MTSHDSGSYEYSHPVTDTHKIARIASDMYTFLCKQDHRVGIPLSPVHCPLPAVHSLSTAYTHFSPLMTLLLLTWTLTLVRWDTAADHDLA